MKPEAAFKVKMVDQVRRAGGYGRRLEDQYAVGVYDCILIPNQSHVYFVEAKIVRGNAKWGPTPRQRLELERVAAARGGAIVVVAGFRPEDGELFLANPDMTAMCRFCVGWNINGCLELWRIHARQS